MGDTDFPAVMANWGNARDLASQWKVRSSGNTSVMTSGTGMPTTTFSSGYGSGSGSDEEPWLVYEESPIVQKWY